MTDILNRQTDHPVPQAIQELDPDFVPGAAIFEVDTSDVVEVPAAAAKPILRFELIDPNRRSFVIFLLVLFAVILSASILWSFNAIVAMSEWMAPAAELRWLPAVFLDMAIIGYSLALAVFKSRGEAGRQKLWMTRLGLIISTGFSVIANGTHTLDFWHGDLSTYQSIIGLVFSSSIPLLALMATEVIIRLAFVDPDQESAPKRRFRTKK